MTNKQLMVNLQTAMNMYNQNIACSYAVKLSYVNKNFKLNYFKLTKKAFFLRLKIPCCGHGKDLLLLALTAEKG